MSPASASVTVSGTQEFHAAGGRAPYTYSIVLGAGSVDVSSGLFTASANTGTTIIQVTDSDGEIKTAVVAVTAIENLNLVPATPSVVVNGSISFSAQGGVAPFVFTKTAGSGSVDSSTGVYTAPAGPGTATVKVEDSSGQTATTTITIVGALAISPSAPTLSINQTQTFSASGGLPPYTYRVNLGSGSISGDTYTAPLAPGSATIRVTDALGNTSDANVTINPGAAAQIVLSGTSPITAGSCVGYSVTSQDAGATVVPVSGSVTVSLSATGSGQFFSDSSCSTQVSSVVLSAMTSAKTFYFLDASAETSQIVATTASLGSALKGVVVNAAPVKKLVHTGQAYLQKTVCSQAFTISAQDGSNNPFPAPATTTISLTGTATTTFYSDSGCSTSITTRTLAQNATSVTFYLKDSVAETVLLTYTATGWNSGSGTVGVWGPLSINPASQTMVVGNTVSFNGVGGAPPYSYSATLGSGVTSGGGNTYSFTAPATPGTGSITVTDAAGNTATSAVTVVSPMVLTASTKSVLANQSFKILPSTDIGCPPPNGNTICISGGSPPYSVSVPTGAGSFNSSNGNYTAPGTSQVLTLTISDTLSNSTSLTVTVLPSPVVDLSFDNAVTNYGANVGSSNGVATTWALNGRTYPVVSATVPTRVTGAPYAPSNSTKSVDFGDGTGWPGGGPKDGAVDLMEPNGFQINYYYGGFSSFAGFGKDPVNLTAVWDCRYQPYPVLTTPLYGSRTNMSGQYRFFGRVLPPSGVTPQFVIGWAGAQQTQMWLNGTSMYSSNYASGSGTDNATALSGYTANNMVDVRVDFSNLDVNGCSSLFLDWTYTGQSTATLIPATNLYAPEPVTELTSMSKFTITGWLNLRDSSVGNTVVLSWLRNGDGNNGVELRYKTNGSLQIGINESAGGTTPSSGAGFVTADSTASNANWVFFAVTFDKTLGSNNIKWYFGSPTSLAAFNTQSTYRAGTSIGTPTAPLSIGNLNPTSLTNRESGLYVFRGLIDNVRIYDSVLSLSDIQSVQIY